MLKPSTNQEAHLKSRLELHQDLLKEKDAHLKELNTAILRLRDKNDTLKREADGWRRAGRREGIYGFTLGAVIFLVIGTIIGHSL